ADALPGFPSKRRHLLPKEILGVETRSFDHEAPQPTTNPDLTVWALMNALKQCSSRVIPLPRQDQASINSPPIRELQVRTKLDMQSMVETPYTLNLQRSQNCDAMVRHLFGEERQERCTRCVQGKGALLGCITTSSSKVCTNCDWNWSGICSL
ncbi:hypothetical protein EDB81DRAFT_619218, partial [Dactylonectria macrodidyma]